MTRLPAKRPEEELKYHRELHSLIAELSTRFIEMKLDRLNETINCVLDKVGSFVDVDRSYVCTFSKDSKTFCNTNEWCADGMHPQISDDCLTFQKLVMVNQAFDKVPAKGKVV